MQAMQQRRLSRKNRRLVAPLGEEIHSLCQISPRKEEITFLARNWKETRN
jgi:hypothetical protein